MHVSCEFGLSVAATMEVDRFSCLRFVYSVLLFRYWHCRCWRRRRSLCQHKMDRNRKLMRFITFVCNKKKMKIRSARRYEKKPNNRGMCVHLKHLQHGTYSCITLIRFSMQSFRCMCVCVCGKVCSERTASFQVECARCEAKKMLPNACRTYDERKLFALICWI